MHEQNPYAAPHARHGHQPRWGYEQAPEDPFFPAARGDRFISSLIDVFVVTLAMLLGVVVGVATGAAAGAEAGIIVGFVVAGLCALGVEIWQWWLISSRGQSIGKRAMGIRIIRISGQPVDFVHGVVLREWVPMLINSFVGVFSLIDILFIFRDDRRCLHDLMAQTRVIRA